MKIVDGLCPYCSEPVKEKPGRVAKQINCDGCGRLLNLPSVFTADDGKTSNLATLEPGLICTFFVGIGFFSSSLIFLIVLISLGSLLLFLLWSQDLGGHAPDLLRARVYGSTERLRIFPFELYLCVGWVLVLLLRLVHFNWLSGVTFCTVMLIAAIMSIQANRLYRESKVTSSKVNLFDFALCIRILRDPSTAFDGRQRADNSAGESYSTAHFTMAEAEKAEKEQLKAENVEELARKRGLCLAEKKKWEDDIDERYNAWLEDEYSRLHAEK